MRRCSTPSASGRARWWPRTGTWRASSSTCASSRARSRRGPEPMPRTLSAEQVEEFRARLCEVAQHRFATEGRDAVSMRQLAEALGCSPMTPYRYFQNNDESLAAVRTAAFDRFAGALEQAAAAAGDCLRAAGQALGCSPMTPYRYFRNKHEILAAVRTAAFDRFAGALE